MKEKEEEVKLSSTGRALPPDPPDSPYDSEMREGLSQSPQDEMDRPGSHVKAMMW